MINRRQFCAGLGTVLGVSAAGGLPAWAKNDLPMPEDVHPAHGYTLEPLRQYLFVDLRHIAPGDLRWLNAAGDSMPVGGPPEPRVPVHADPSNMPYGIRLAAQPARREGPFDDPGPLGNGAVVYDGGAYRAWQFRANYPAGTDLGSYSNATIQSMTVIYFESNDGYAWNRREVCELTVPPITAVEGPTFLIDPQGDPKERHKALFSARLTDENEIAAHWTEYQKIHPLNRDVRIKPERLYVFYGLTSPDGLQWERIPEPLFIHFGDTRNTLHYDAYLRKYVLYTRLYWLSRRMVARTESDDFRHWSPLEPVLWPGLDDPFSYDIYTNARTDYPGLPSYHLMFPLFYRRYTQTSEIRMFASYDGKRWNQLPGVPVLEAGAPEPWGGEYINVDSTLIPLAGDRIALPYTEVAFPHKYPRWPGVLNSKNGYACWPKGRLAAVVADEVGEFHTFELPVMGRELRVNARVWKSGEVRVGVVGVAGRAAEDCDAITGDNPAHVVTWKGESQTNAEAGKNVQLHFKLRAAEVFGFEWV